MPQVTVSYGQDLRTTAIQSGGRLGDAIIATGLPLEQPCAGRGTCLKCRVMAQGELSALDDLELSALTSAERAVDYRLACRAHVLGAASVTLAPIVVYSNKVFRACDDYKRDGVPLGLAIDLGSTTVAAFVTTLDQGRVCAGAAALNQQTAFGADVISRLAAAQEGGENARRLSVLALASMVQAVDALKLTPRMRARIQKVTIVGNCAMHHLLLRYPVDSLAVLPFQPHSRTAVRRPEGIFGDTFPARAEILLPPVIGGFVGSDTLACLAYYGFDRAPAPMAAIDLGTNGEVMVTDGKRIVVASTAAGPAFEGVNISCGTRALDGAIVAVKANADGTLVLTTIGDQPPVGLTGSGLLDLVYELYAAGVIDRTGRMAEHHLTFGACLSQDAEGIRRFLLANRSAPPANGESEPAQASTPFYLTQLDIRELQKAKAATRAAMEILLARLGLAARDLRRVILTGSFGSQLNVSAVLGLGMIPSVDPAIVEPSANGAGMGAALFLDDREFERGERIARLAEQINLDLDADFNRRYVRGMNLQEAP
jgi:uncharacterized 2Fe-2S/4Fe-4S cluster protein (DUF4445 family)